MIASPRPARVAAFLAVFGCGLALAAEPWHPARPIAQEIPAFRAPEIPPDAQREPAVLPEPEGALSLADALSLALSRNPELVLSSWETRAGEARELQAGTIPNPRLGFRWQTDRNATGGFDRDQARKRVTLSQILELGGDRERRVTVARTERDMAAWDYEAARIEVATVTAARFAAVLGAQRRVEAARSLVEFVETMRVRVQGLVENGTIGTIETHRITLRLAGARIDLQEAESALGAARFALASSWGGPSPRFSEAVGDLEERPHLPSLDAVLELARQSPAITRWDAELARAQAALSLARAERVPDLDYGVGIRWGDELSRREYLVDLGVSLPIFDHKQGDVREARFEMERARAGRTAAETQASAEIAAAYYDLAEADTAARAFGEEIVPAARAVFEANQTGFDRVSDHIDDVLDARRDLARAEIEHAEALVAYHQALATLEGLIGQDLAGLE